MADAFKYMLAVNNQQIPVGYNMPNPHLSHPNFPNETKLPWGIFDQTLMGRLILLVSKEYLMWPLLIQKLWHLN